MKSAAVSNVDEPVVKIAECEAFSDRRAYRGDANNADASLTWINTAITFDRFGNVQCPPVPDPD